MYLAINFQCLTCIVDKDVFRHHRIRKFEKRR